MGWTHLTEPSTHSKVDEWIDTGVRKTKEIDGEHREEKMSMVQKVFCLELSDDGH